MLIVAIMMTMSPLLIVVVVCSCQIFCKGFLIPSSHHNNLRRVISRQRQYSSITSGDDGTNTQELSSPITKGVSKSTDPEYPYQFTGRLWFSPSIVKVPNNYDSLLSKDVNIISLFGYTLGGTVALEYDTSPVGPYFEYVTMSALVTKKGSIGQWGSRLYVSTQEAEDVCKEVWGVPAEVSNIEFCEGSSDLDSNYNIPSLMVTKPPSSDSPVGHIQNIRLEGWQNTRILNLEEYKNGQAQRLGNIPVLWTPTIKALWSPWIAGGLNSIKKEKSFTKELPLHKLRLSASAIRLSWSGLKRRLDHDTCRKTKEQMGLSLGFGLIVDNVLIEIGIKHGLF